jgi:hypothetical protein
MFKLNVFLKTFFTRKKPIQLLSLSNSYRNYSNFTTDVLIQNTIKIKKKVCSKRKFYLISKKLNYYGFFYLFSN